MSTVRNIFATNTNKEAVQVPLKGLNPTILQCLLCLGLKYSDLFKPSEGHSTNRKAYVFSGVCYKSTIFTYNASIWNDTTKHIFSTLLYTFKTEHLIMDDKYIGANNAF